MGVAGAVDGGAARHVAAFVAAATPMESALIACMRI